MRQIVCLLLPISLLTACSHSDKADLLIYNAKIYTIDDSFHLAEAMAIKDGKVLETGTTAHLLEKYSAADSLNAQGRVIYPGFIDAHTHFYRYGLGLQAADLTGTKSWNDIVQYLRDFGIAKPQGWLIGRGWDQNDWAVKTFPNKQLLDQYFPDRPVFLTRVDGHAAIVNQRALDMAGIKPGDTVAGGEIRMHQGQITGILVDNAVDLVAKVLPAPGTSTQTTALLDAQTNCFAVGLTTVDDCGLDYPIIQLIDSLQKADTLKMRIYAMLSDVPRNYDFAKKQGKIKTGRLNVRAFKVYADGALGSYGACLLQPYADRPGWSGFLLSTPAHFDSVARVIDQLGFQMCTHAIGDSGNRVILDIYAKYLKKGNDHRWRIEHAQVVHPDDVTKFGAYSIVPSVQPTHATSDMYWAGDRLGPDRVKTAYAYKDLLEQNGWLPLGTDFPVEDISPFRTFYAAVVRKDINGWPETGFQTENALSRQQALRGITIWAARSNFEEQEKGSLEKGKLADFIITDTDLMTASPAGILNARVFYTFVNGKKVFERK